MGLRGKWQPETWNAQRSGFYAAFAPQPPVLPQPSVNVAARLSNVWPTLNWPTQGVAFVAPFYSSNTPPSPVGLYVQELDFTDSSYDQPRTFRFPIVTPTDAHILTFDFSEQLQPGQILTGTIGIAVEAFADPTVVVGSAILNGVASFDSTLTKAMQPINAALGVAGIEYYITCTCSTANPQTTLVRTGILSIIG